MKEIKKQLGYTEPEIEVIHMTETDIITTSGWQDPDYEGEFVPMDNQR